MAISQQPQARPGWLDALARDRRRAAYGLFIAAALLAIIPIWLLVKYRSGYWDTALAAFFLALVPAGVGLWYVLRESDEMSDHDAARMLVLATGGLWGIGLVALSLSLTY